ncbi:hypothetical protein [Tropicimonas sp. S265A]|uniref:hypothetical protein n=1 Tax=Tropicimonas sp. S265A TaxID=3415134 RepID=UPI003C7B0B5B
MTMFDPTSSPVAGAVGSTSVPLHMELAERLAETQSVLSFARLLPVQTSLTRGAPSNLVPFPGSED